LLHKLGKGNGLFEIQSFILHLESAHQFSKVLIKPNETIRRAQTNVISLLEGNSVQTNKKYRLLNGKQHLG